VGEFLALSTCSNCHSLSATGMRPLARYFGGNTDVAQIASTCRPRWARGHDLHAAHSLRDDEAQALATYIASLAPPKLRRARRPQAPTSPRPKRPTVLEGAAR
jgi:mono/diheme cytochrome c family protein